MTGPDGDRRVETDESAADSGRPEDAESAADAERAAERPRLATAAFAALVFVASVVPVPTGASGGSAGGAVGRFAGALPAEVGLTAPFHFLGYAAIAALLVRGAGGERRFVAVAVTAVAATAFGFGIELVQASIPWRSFAWSDAAVNAAGAIAGAAFGTVAEAVAPRERRR